MTITHTDIWKFSIPMHPFTIATGTMHFAQNIFIRVHVQNGMYGVGECSAFPMIVGETQATCFEMAKEFAALWKEKDAIDIVGRLGWQSVIVKVLHWKELGEQSNSTDVITMPVSGNVMINLRQSGNVLSYVEYSLRISFFREARIDQH